MTTSALSIVGSRIMRLLMALLVAGARGDKQGWVPTCDSNASAPFHYDFVEVGTNDFDTLIELARDCTRGLSVDAMQFYLDRLPNPPHVTKRNAAIMDPPPADGNVNFFYIDYADLVAHNLTKLKGSAQIGQPERWSSTELHKHGLSHLMRNKSMPALSMAQLLRAEGVRSIGYLKLDLNGIEPGVLRSLHDACEAQPSLWPRRITYEQGTMPHSENKHALIHMFTQHGYTPALKPIEVRKPGHSLHYSHITWDMVLELK